MPTPVTRTLRREDPRPAHAAGANDNDPQAEGIAMLRAALRLSHRYGAAAAQYAQHRVEAAFFTGEPDACTWWRAITRILDRMLASEKPAASALKLPAESAARH